MSFIVVMRNPRSKALLAMVDYGTDCICEFESEDEAIEEAERSTAFNAWGYSVIETDI